MSLLSLSSIQIFIFCSSWVSVNSLVFISFVYVAAWQLSTIDSFLGVHWNQFYHNEDHCSRKSHFDRSIVSYLSVVLLINYPLDDRMSLYFISIFAILSHEYMHHILDIFLLSNAFCATLISIISRFSVIAVVWTITLNQHSESMSLVIGILYPTTSFRYCLSNMLRQSRHVKNVSPPSTHRTYEIIDCLSQSIENNLEFKILNTLNSNDFF